MTLGICKGRIGGLWPFSKDLFCQCSILGVPWVCPQFLWLAVMTPVGFGGPQEEALSQRLGLGVLFLGYGHHRFRGRYCPSFVPIKGTMANKE